MIDQSSAKAQAAIGAAITAAGGTPLWLQVVEGVTSTAGMIAAVCGAVVGIHGVYRIVRNKLRGG